MQTLKTTSGTYFLFDQKIYRHNKTVLSKSFYRCKTKECSGRATSCDGVVTARNHSCTVSPETIATMTLLSEQCVRLESTRVPIPDVTSEVLATVSEDVATQLPSTNALRMRFFRKQRKHAPAVPSDNRFDIPSRFKITSRGANFLVCDVSRGTHRVLSFASERDLQSLHSARTVYGDGTFDICPRNFRQLYTLHTYEHGKAFPRVYCLLSGKSVDVYRIMFRELRHYMNDVLSCSFAPSIYISDFEESVLRVIAEEFPGAEHYCCFFHYGQCIINRIQRRGMIIEYKTNVTFRTAVRMILALAYLPEAEIPECFQALSNCSARNNYLFVSFCAYFSSEWLPKRHLWSLWNRTPEQRTNNVVESWHHRIKQKVKISHPNVWRLIQHFQEEESYVANQSARLAAQVESLRAPSKSLQRKRRCIERTRANYVSGRVSVMVFLHKISRFHRHPRNASASAQASLQELGLSTDLTIVSSANTSIAPANSALEVTHFITPTTHTFQEDGPFEVVELTSQAPDPVAFEEAHVVEIQSVANVSASVASDEVSVEPGLSPSPPALPAPQPALPSPPPTDSSAARYAFPSAAYFKSLPKRDKARLIKRLMQSQHISASEVKARIGL